MKQRQLGKDGPMVSAIGLGCMSFGGIFGATTEMESFACLDAAHGAGITFFDTANIYGMGVSETVLGNWMRSRRPNIHIATKASIVSGASADLTILKTICGQNWKHPFSVWAPIMWPFSTSIAVKRPARLRMSWKHWGG